MAKTETKPEVLPDGEVVQETTTFRLTPGLVTALVAVQKAMKPAAKSATGQVATRKYPYANLGDCWEAVQALLASNNLAVTHLPQATDGSCVRVLTLIVHAPSLGWLMSELVMKPTVETPQTVGGVLTYCRRYAMTAMLGIVVEDDDASAASQPHPGGAARQQAPAAKAPASGRPPSGRPPKDPATTEQLKEITALLKQICGDDAEARRNAYHTAADFIDKEGNPRNAPDDLRMMSAKWAGTAIGNLKKHIAAVAKQGGDEAPPVEPEDESQAPLGDSYEGQDLEDETIPF